VLGAVVVAVGLQFRAQVSGAEDTIVGLILLATAVGFTIAELTGRGHHHDHSHDDHDHGDHHHGRLSGPAAVIVPFGAAASPDLTILPVFLAAAAVGTGTAIASVTVFAVVTIVSIMGLTLAAFAGGLQIRGDWLERWGNIITALALAVIGALVLTGVL